jgi:hypothetical protein
MSSLLDYRRLRVCECEPASGYIYARSNFPFAATPAILILLLGM